MVDLFCSASSKQMTTPAFASAAGRMRGGAYLAHSCRRRRFTIFIMMAASFSPQPVGCGTLALRLSLVATFCPQNLAKINPAASVHVAFRARVLPARRRREARRPINRRSSSGPSIIPYDFRQIG
ncbi:MAG: hypothetical protein FWD12_05065 [Alphaproteobacteria bacterium]|nr:hypothetical protein [Alphaproteobacteria bacterium]